MASPLHLWERYRRLRRLKVEGRGSEEPDQQDLERLYELISLHSERLEGQGISTWQSPYVFLMDPFLNPGDAWLIREASSLGLGAPLTMRLYARLMGLGLELPTFDDVRYFLEGYGRVLDALASLYGIKDEMEILLERRDLLKKAIDVIRAFSEGEEYEDEDGEIGPLPLDRDYYVRQALTNLDPEIIGLMFTRDAPGALERIEEYVETVIMELEEGERGKALREMFEREKAAEGIEVIGEGLIQSRAVARIMTELEEVQKSARGSKGVDISRLEELLRNLKGRKEAIEKALDLLGGWREGRETPIQQLLSDSEEVKEAIIGGLEVKDVVDTYLSPEEAARILISLYGIYSLAESKIGYALSKSKMEGGLKPEQLKLVIEPLKRGLKWFGSTHTDG